MVSIKILHHTNNGNEVIILTLEEQINIHKSWILRFPKSIWLLHFLCSYDAESWRSDSKASTERSLVTLARLEKSCGRDSNAIKPATLTNCTRYASLPKKTASSLIAIIISLSIIWHMGIGTSECGLVVIHIGKSWEAWGIALQQYVMVTMIIPLSSL